MIQSLNLDYPQIQINSSHTSFALEDNKDREQSYPSLPSINNKILDETSKRQKETKIPQSIAKNVQKNMIKLSTQAFLQYFLTQEDSIKQYIKQNQLDILYGQQNFYNSLIQKYNNKKQCKIINQQQFRNLFYDKPFLKMMGIKQKFRLTQKQKFNKKRAQKASFRILQKQQPALQKVSEYEKLLNHFNQTDNKEDITQSNIQELDLNQKELIELEEDHPKLVLKQEKKELYDQWLQEQPHNIQKQAAEKKLLRTFAYKFFSKDFIIYCLNSKMQYPIEFFRQQNQILKIISLEDIL